MLRHSLFVVAFTAALVVVGCGDTDSPTAPTTPAAAQFDAPAVAPVRYAPPGGGGVVSPRAGTASTPTISSPATTTAC